MTFAGSTGAQALLGAAAAQGRIIESLLAQRPHDGLPSLAMVAFRGFDELAVCHAKWGVALLVRE